jgi:hypothetical protein
VLAASRWQRLVKLALPSALPFIFSGFKIAAPLAVLGTLIAEWMGAERGVGIMMIYAMFSFDAPQVWMTIVAVCLMAIGGYGAFALIERVYLRWSGHGGGGDMTSPVDTPDWRALPTRGQRAEARLAAFWRFVFRTGIGVALLVTLWGGADHGLRRARIRRPRTGSDVADLPGTRGSAVRGARLHADRCRLRPDARRRHRAIVGRRSSPSRPRPPARSCRW